MLFRLDLSFLISVCLFLSYYSVDAARIARALRHDKAIRLPLSQRSHSALDRRQISASISNQIRTYMIEIAIGSTGQRTTLALDTGSPDTWTFVPSSCNNCKGGSYNESHPSTDIARPDLGIFDLSYVDGTTAAGSYHNDDILIGETKVANITFAMVNETGESHYGILGLGPQALQSSAVKYPTILDAMKKQGLIDWRGYSLQLNAETAEGGHILFGGWDAERYQFMPSVPMWTKDGEIHHLAIDWNSITVWNENGSIGYSNMSVTQPVVFDTGYTLSTLPDHIFVVIAQQFGVKRSGENYYASCHQPSGYIELRFGSSQLSIVVPFSELVIPANLQVGVDVGQDLCMFGFRPASSWGGAGSMLSFGDTVLRSAYLLVDYDHMMIGIAQADPVLYQGYTRKT